MCVLSRLRKGGGKGEGGRLCMLFTYVYTCIHVCEGLPGFPSLNAGEGSIIPFLVLCCMILINCSVHFKVYV